ncbi:hypothetical protein ACFYXM_21550 [Streptomyces sp. NPDC002476]|uniref:hypothetical protein n=1 Tax=Streptomyces sp. NPDC002476 TaxID=3364648 RepID=UPI0036BB3415
MISEPEMTGDFGPTDSREVMDGFGNDPVGRPGERRPWLWALGGAVMATVLWAGAFFLYGLGDRRPDMHGYRLDKDPCPSLRLKSIGAAIGPRESTTDTGPRVVSHAALDQVRCYIPLRSPDGEEQPARGWSIAYSVGVMVALHKQTDPRAEFEALRRVTDLGIAPEAKLETVPNLGDRAYLLTSDDETSELRVLEGGAVFSLSLSVFTHYLNSSPDERPPDDGPETPNASAYHSALISDMRDLMASLKR